jgi:multisubunit Na+/H+ antiporter MnhC subunit
MATAPRKFANPAVEALVTVVVIGVALAAMVVFRRRRLKVP